MTGRSAWPTQIDRAARSVIHAKEGWAFHLGVAQRPLTKGFLPLSQHGRTGDVRNSLRKSLGDHRPKYREETMKVCVPPAHHSEPALFRQQWQIYGKVVDYNYLFHREATKNRKTPRGNNENTRSSDACRIGNQLCFADLCSTNKHA
jgi:hypothetical protein